MIAVDMVNSAASKTINFNNNTADADGNKWWITDLPGWELPEPRQQWLDNVGDHGGIPAESFFGVRAISLVGVVSNISSSDNYWKAWNKLCGIFADDIVGDVNYGTLTVHETPTSRFVFVKLAGRPKHQFLGPIFNFEIPLKCPNPHKYLTGAGTPGSGGNPGTF